MNQEHPFAQFVRIPGKAKTGSRNLNQTEARQAFNDILAARAEPVQLGAFLMLLRVKSAAALSPWRGDSPDVYGELAVQQTTAAALLLLEAARGTTGAEFAAA